MDRNRIIAREYDWDALVALRKESVDRNVIDECRRQVCIVALRKESVDRNDNGNAVAVSDLGRSPQGERG